MSLPKFYLRENVVPKTLRVRTMARQAAFDAIDAEFASMEDYLHRQLGVDAAGREVPRERYLR